MLTSEIGVMAPNKGIYIPTAFLRAKIAVVAIVWTRLKMTIKDLFIFCCRRSVNEALDRRFQSP